MKPTQKQRQLNIELLRIAAMLMVLNLHSNFVAFNAPTVTHDGVTVSIARNFWEALCMCAVNVFVMISGWFGIKASLKGFCNLLWQVAYISIIAVAIQTIVFDVQLSPRLLFSCGGWFVASYIVLYILSPILNAYIESTPLKSIRNLLAVFFLLEFIWGFTDSVSFLLNGYSPIPFIGLYILAAYLRKKGTSLKPSKAFLGYLASCLLATIAMTIHSASTDLKNLTFFYGYLSPFIISAAAFLLLTFAAIPDERLRKKPFGKLIPWFASSAFAIYLLHAGTRFAFQLYTRTVRETYTADPGFNGALIIVGIIFGVFFAAIIIDKPRILIWRRVLLPLFNRREKTQTCAD